MVESWEVTLNLGEKIPGKILLTLLQKIDDTGSLNRAVEEAGVSYRYGWGLLNRAEEAVGRSLVSRQAGGAAGGGTSLTDEGRKLLGCMQSLQREVEGQLSALLSEKGPVSGGQLLIASTMEPVVTGLLDILEHAYLHESGVVVRHIAAGSGQAMEMAKAGRVDLLLTHAPELEVEFVGEGWGTKRVPVMTNEYIVVGPDADGANVATAASAAEAFSRIATSEACFVSRADRSGTHLFERSLWQLAGIFPDGKHWYHEERNLLGNYGILRRAAETGCYTLVDRASYSAGYAGEELRILFSGDPLLKNTFSAIPVSRAKAAVNQDEAEKFAAWLVSPSACSLIGGFGRQEYGLSLFEPISPQ